MGTIFEIAYRKRAKFLKRFFRKVIIKRDLKKDVFVQVAKKEESKKNLCNSEDVGSNPT